MSLMSLMMACPSAFHPCQLPGETCPAHQSSFHFNKYIKSFVSNFPSPVHHHGHLTLRVVHYHWKDCGLDWGVLVVAECGGVSHSYIYNSLCIRCIFIYGRNTIFFLYYYLSLFHIVWDDNFTLRRLIFILGYTLGWVWCAFDFGTYTLFFILNY